MFNSPNGGVPWNDLRKILPECQQMANVSNIVEILPKISLAWVGCWVHERYRQTTDGRTDGRRHIANSEFTFADKTDQLPAASQEDLCTCEVDDMTWGTYVYAYESERGTRETGDHTPRVSPGSCPWAAWRWATRGRGSRRRTIAQTSATTRHTAVRQLHRTI